jgi:hypothetical protein
VNFRGDMRYFVLCFALCVSAAAEDLRRPADPGTRPAFLAHYMPWYRTPKTGGAWGWHWTMNHFDPERIDSEGRREIASNFYPVTGPYDSTDPVLLEYQTLLMKLSGIDGVLVDWYGPDDFNDYASIHEAAIALFDACRRAGLQFAVVYEDQTVKHMVEAGRLEPQDAIGHGRSVMRFLEEEWFGDASYFKRDGRPLLLTFGPQYYTAASDWEALFSELAIRPLFFTLDNRLAPAAEGAFPWPPMWKTSSDGILTWRALDDYLTAFYRESDAWPYRIGGAFPGFDDVYAEAGTGGGYGFLDSRNGDTFRSTLETAVSNHQDVIQIITWNDYGEGTMVEPTRETGLRYLEEIRRQRAALDASFQTRAGDLDLPLRVWNLRRELKGDPAVMRALDDVAGCVFSDASARAGAMMDSLTAALEQGCDGVGACLDPGFPNPFTTTIRFEYTLADPCAVELSVFDVSGRRAAGLVDQEQTEGRHSTTWDGLGCGSGVYLCVLKAGKTVAATKFLKLN